MENNIIIQENQQPSVRNIDTITSEILNIKAYAQNTALVCAIELGRRFKEAKSMLPHGEWGKWLKDTVDFSQSSVNNYMKIFEYMLISQPIEKMLLHRIKKFARYHIPQKFSYSYLRMIGKNQLCP